MSTIGSSPDLSVVHGYVDRGTSQSYKEHSSGSFNLDLRVYQNMDMMKKMSEGSLWTGAEADGSILAACRYSVVLDRRARGC